MVDAAVDEEQVWLVGKLLVPVEIALEAPRQHLLHGGIVVGAVHVLQLEAAIVPLEGLCVDVHHHGGHDVVGALVGDVVGLDAPGGRVQIQHPAQQLHQLALPLLPGGPALHLLHRVFVGQADEIHLGPPLGGDQLHPVPRLLGQKAHQGHRVLQLAGQEDLPGQAAPAAVVLPHQGGEDVRPVLLHGCLDELPVLGRQLALHIVEHHKAAPGGLPLVEAHHVGVRQGARHHLLPLAQQLDGLEAVPQLGGLLEAQLLRRLLHLGQQLLPHLLELPLQQAHRLVDGLPVAGLIHLLPAVAVTLAHVVIQAGPLLSDVSGELPAARGQLQGDAQGVDDILGAPPAAVGAEVPRPVLRRPVGQGEAGVGLLHRQADVGVALVVLEQDVVVGLVALDEGVLQNQRLKLRVGHNHVEVVNLAHHGPGLLRVGG